MDNCLLNIVGLSESECPCFEDNKPTEANESLSGFFIDDGQFGIPLSIPKSIEDCEKSDMWEMLKKARMQGLSNFKDALFADLTKNSSQRFRSVTDQVGKDNHTLAGVCDNYGWKISGKGQKGLKMKIHAIGLKLNVSEAVDVDVDGTTVTINTTADEVTWENLATPIDINLSDDFGIGRIICVNYQTTGRAYRTGIQCTCNGSSWFSEYAKVQGYCASEACSMKAKNKQGFGLLMKVTFYCDPFLWLCQENVCYETDPVARTLARALQLFQINSLIECILNSDKLNRYTLAKREFLSNKIKHNYEAVEERMNYLISEIPQSKTSCYSCASRVRVGSLAD